MYTSSASALNRDIQGKGHNNKLEGILCVIFLTCPEDISASVTPGGELGVVARPAVDAVGLGAELFVHQGGATLGANETSLMPVLLLVRKILKSKSKVLKKYPDS